MIDYGGRAALPSCLWQPEGSREGWRPYRLAPSETDPGRAQRTRPRRSRKSCGAWFRKSGSRARRDARVLVPPSPRAVRGRPPQAGRLRTVPLCPYPFILRANGNEPIPDVVNRQNFVSFSFLVFRAPAAGAGGAASDPCHPAAPRVMQGAVPSAAVHSARERERTHSRYPSSIKICVNHVGIFRAPAADASRFGWSSARVAGPVSPPPGAGPAATRGANASKRTHCGNSELVQIYEKRLRQIVQKRVDRAPFKMAGGWVRAPGGTGSLPPTIQAGPGATNHMVSCAGMPTDRAPCATRPTGP
jgi:hypothetical protein